MSSSGRVGILTKGRTGMSAVNKRPLLVWAMMMIALVAACAPHDRSAEWEQTVKAKARVTKIDYDARRIEVRIGFERITMRVAKNYEAFDRRRVGDVIDLVYYEAVLVSIEREQTVGGEVETKYRLSPATQGHPPIALARARQFTAEYIDYDYQSGIATFRKSDDSYPQLIVPLRLRPFVRTLVPGDRIAVSIEEAIAVSFPPQN
jgi:hypothetical protein